MQSHGISQEKVVREFGNLCRPYGVALTKKETIVVAQNGHNCVSILNKEGRHMKSFGTSRTIGGIERASFFKFPRGIAIGKDRHLLVTDSHQLTKLSANGKSVQRIGDVTPGKDDYNFNCPAGVVVDYTSGNIVVADCENNRLQVFNRDVEYLWSLPTPTHPLTAPGTPTRSTKACSPGKSASLGKGNSLSKSNSMSKSSSLGKIGGSMGKGASLGSSSKTSTLHSKAGSFLIVDDPFSPSKLLQNPVALSFDGRDLDYIYVVEWLDRVKKISIPNEESVLTFGSPETEKIPLSYPTGIATDSDHSLLYVTERGNHRVSVFDTDGKFVMCFGKHGNKKGQFNGPYGVAVDKNDIYISDYYNDRIVQYDSRYL